MLGFGGGEPPAGATPQVAAEASQTSPSSPETLDVSTVGPREQWEKANAAVGDAELRMGKDLVSIVDDLKKVVDNIGGQLMEDNSPAKEAGHDLPTKSGTFVDSDGKTLDVVLIGRKNYTDLRFCDPAAPTRRFLEITEAGITMSTLPKGGLKGDRYWESLDNLDKIDLRFGVNSVPWGEVDSHTNNNRRVALYAIEGGRKTDPDVINDYKREGIQAAREGLDFLLKPGVVLKPAETPPVTPVQPATPTI